MVTPCLINELKLIGEPLKFVLDKAKSFKIFECNHDKDQSAKLCLKDQIGFDNQHHFVIFT